MNPVEQEQQRMEVYKGLPMDLKKLPTHHNKALVRRIQERESMTSDELYCKAIEHSKKKRTGHNLREKLLKKLHQRKIEKSDA
jgi:hypothetical protein